MILENEIKLDFKDVLIRPKRSNLISRSEVDVEREFVFKRLYINGKVLLLWWQIWTPPEHLKWQQLSININYLPVFINIIL